MYFHCLDTVFFMDQQKISSEANIQVIRDWGFYINNLFNVNPVESLIFGFN